MIKNIIFDFGGVLVDWNPHHLFSYALRHVIIQSCIIKICVASIPFPLSYDGKEGAIRSSYAQRIYSGSSLIHLTNHRQVNAWR